MKNEITKPISFNGLVLKKGDRVILTGKVPNDSIVNYANPMYKLLNNKKEYIIDSIFKHDINDGYYINTATWSWDCRNITKITKDIIEDRKPELFNPINLDI